MWRKSSSGVFKKTFYVLSVYCTIPYYHIAYFTSEFRAVDKNKIYSTAQLPVYLANWFSIFSREIFASQSLTMFWVPVPVTLENKWVDISFTSGCRADSAAGRKPYLWPLLFLILLRQIHFAIWDKFEIGWHYPPSLGSQDDQEVMLVTSWITGH